MVIGNSNYILSDVIDEDLYSMSDIWRYSGRNVLKLQNIAEHSFYVAFKVIQLGYKLNISEDRINKAIRVALCHDCGEIYTGDIPHSLKVYSPEIREISENLENKLISEHFPEFSKAFDDFTNDEDPIVTKLVIAADCLDAVMYTSREIELGNKNKDIEVVHNECLERYITVIIELKNLISKDDEKEN